MDFPMTRSDEKTKVVGGDKSIYLPKGTLLEKNLTQDEFWAGLDDLVTKFGCRGRGELLVRLVAGDLEIVVPRKKR